MKWSHTLAAIIVLAVGGALVQARPPIQLRILEAPAQIGGDDVLVMGSKQAPSGKMYAWYSTSSGTGLAVSNGDTWDVIRAPVTLESAATDPQAWALGAYPMIQNHEIIVKMTNASSGETVTALRVIPLNDPTQEFELIRFPQGSTAGFINTNPAGDVVWVKDNLLPGASIWLYHRASGTERLVKSGGLYEYDFFTEFTLGNGTLTYLEWDNEMGTWYRYDYDAQGGSHDVVAYDCWDCGPFAALYTNNPGDVLVYKKRMLTWNPSNPSRTPAFTYQRAGNEAARDFSVSDNGLVQFVDDNAVMLGPGGPDHTLFVEGESIAGLETRFVFPGPIASNGTSLWSVTFTDSSRRGYFVTICPVDLNRDGFVDNGDIGEFVNAYLEGSSRVDFNNDGFVDTGDITEFVGQFLEGC